MALQSMAVRVGFETEREIVAASITASYVALGTPLAQAARILIIQNWTDAYVAFSDDGLTNKISLPPSGQLIIDFTGNKTHQNGFFVAEGTQWYATRKSGVPSTGSVVMSVLYGDIN